MSKIYNVQVVQWASFLVLTFNFTFITSHGFNFFKMVSRYG